MPSEPSGTDPLLAHVKGDRMAVDRLVPMIYGRLRRQAAAYMRQERGNHTLEPTALVHEAYARLVDATRVDWQGKTHFFAIAAQEMRRVLREHARKHKAEKRGGGLRNVSLSENAALAPGQPLDFLAMDEALENLARRNKRRGRVVELRIFAGMSSKETASVLGISERTAREDWRVAKAWLAKELGIRKGSDGG